MPLKLVRKKNIPAKTNVVIQAVPKSVPKKIKSVSRSFFEIVGDDLKDSLSVVFRKSEVMVFALLAVSLVAFHPNGMKSGPLGDLAKSYPEHSFFLFLEKQFQRFLAVFVFVPVWFSVPKDKTGPAIILTVLWITLAKVSYTEHFMLALFLFLILSVRRVQTRASIIALAFFTYLIMYGNRIPEPIVTVGANAPTAIPTATNSTR